MMTNKRVRLCAVSDGKICEEIPGYFEKLFLDNGASRFSFAGVNDFILWMSETDDGAFRSPQELIPDYLKDFPQVLSSVLVIIHNPDNWLETRVITEVEIKEFKKIRNRKSNK